MKTYIKISGPPLLKAIKSLENLAIPLDEICIMDQLILNSYTTTTTPEEFLDYFSELPREISIERCKNIISNSGETLGEYDFFFEWFIEPNTSQLHDLIEKIDEDGCHKCPR